MIPVSFSRKQTSNQHTEGSLEGKIFSWFKIVTYVSLANLGPGRYYNLFISK